MTNIELANAFYEDYQELCAKYAIVETLCFDIDTDTMGFCQAYKVWDSEDGPIIVFGYSGNGKKLCPCCTKEKE